MTVSRHLSLIAAVASLALLTAGRADTRAQGVTRTLYATATDDDGKPVLDMRSDEFEVREGGRVQEISTRAATKPLRVALIVSDRGGGQFQTGVLRFCEAVLGNGEISLIGVVIQPERLTDFTNSPDTLRSGILRLGRRSTAPGAGAQLIEAIQDAAKVVRREGTRPAIVIMRSGGEETTPIAANTVLNAIRASGAVMYVISPSGVDRGLAMSRTSGESVTVVPTVLGGYRETGGRQIDVVVNTMGPVMQQVASELLNQYEITYTLPAGTKPNDRVSVTAKRKGVTVRAPTRIGS